MRKGQLARLTLGTDTPGGTGVIPRGMLRNICYLASVCGVPAGEAVAIATGNTAKAHGLDVGILAPGRPADIVVCGPVEGSAGTGIADAIAHGDLPGIAYVIAERRDRGQRPQPADAAAEAHAVLLLLRRATAAWFRRDVKNAGAYF